MVEPVLIPESIKTEPFEPSTSEVAEGIAEPEGDRERLVEDFTPTAKKAKLPKSIAIAQLKNHPEIVKIVPVDASLAYTAFLSQLNKQSSADHVVAHPITIEIEA